MPRLEIWGHNVGQTFNQPLGGNEVPRFGGPSTMMRLPACNDAAGLDACFVGVPLDIGASNRSGTRFGPRQIRAESSMIRPYNMATGAAPFDVMQVGDIGDVPINTFDLKDSVARISAFYRDVLKRDVVPLTTGRRSHADLPGLAGDSREIWIGRTDTCRCTCRYQRCDVRRENRPWNTFSSCL